MVTVPSALFADCAKALLAASIPIKAPTKTNRFISGLQMSSNIAHYSQIRASRVPTSAFGDDDVAGKGPNRDRCAAIAVSRTHGAASHHAVPTATVPVTVVAANGHRQV